jgi:hypothetical protein
LLANPDEPSTAAANSKGNENSGGVVEVEEKTTTADPGSTTADPTPKSYKCEDCGKIFSNMDTVEFHAAKTNHSNFSESTEEKKPLTAEEKEEQQKKLLELLKAKRIEREAKEKAEELQREKQRMASGKDLGEAKRRIEEQQMKELIEQKKREKIDDKQARDRALRLIEADKLARKEKFGGGGGGGVEVQKTAPKPTTETRIPQVDKKEYTETKLQVDINFYILILESFFQINKCFFYSYDFLVEKQ